jgi:hypothetical protein
MGPFAQIMLQQMMFMVAASMLVCVAFAHLPGSNHAAQGRGVTHADRVKS